MLVGHFAASFIAKRASPEVSLGTLVLASLLPDCLWVTFLLAGVEHVQIKPGRGAINYLDFEYVPFSHSLLMDAVWGAALGAAYFAYRKNRRGAIALFLLVVSHWLLDFISNRGMPLAPGLAPTLGLELWKSIPATIVVEGGLWLLGLILYVGATSARNRWGIFAFWGVIAFLTLAWRNNIAGPPPPSASAMGISSAVFFVLTVAWAFWMNRVRTPKPA